MSYVHGDLNFANILVDARRNVWVIDFFHAGPGHVLKDLAKFENDLLFLLTPLEDASQLLEALALTRALRSVTDLRAAAPSRPDQVRPPRSSGPGGCSGSSAGRSPAVPGGPSPVATRGRAAPLRRAHARLRRTVRSAEAVGAGGGVLARRADHPHRRS